MLHAEESGDGPRLVLAHGFTQNLACWGRLPALFDVDHRVVRVDLPGHGRSQHDEADLWEAGALLSAVGGTAAYVGYSMGGRVALHAALATPSSITQLVLVGVNAGIDDRDERESRQRADEVLAARLEAEATGHGAGRDEALGRFLDDWLAGPLFATLPAAAAHRRDRLTNRVDGLVASLRHCGTGTQASLWPRLSALPMPVLLVAGVLDTKFTALAQRTAEAIGPQARLALIADAGHACHLEQPDAFAAEVRSFLAETTPIP